LRFEPRRDLYRREGIRSLLMIALRIRDDAPGAISFYYRKPHSFSAGDVRVATALANLAGSALVLAELYEEQIRLRADAQDVTDALHYKNEELQQFAYVASHDLQEPLRMINGYAKLLTKRYSGTLDPEAEEFFGFMIGGVERMQTLIRDLLAYSRVANTNDRPHEHVSLDSVLDDVLLNLRASIEKEGAMVTQDHLPKVLTWRTQMTQLLQNLIGNALKYRRDETPRIHVAAENRGKEWVFSVKDNGLGIDERHFDRVFGIFKRLHGPEYPGTGIGLAISRRIVERHRGRMWVESKLGEGSTFCFTLPADIVESD
jgi:light-regulated signal transduction histidine kinase (bacteriophytochrome)